MSNGVLRGSSPTFGARLAAAMDEHGPLCVGIDPHPTLLTRWGLTDDASGLRTFAMTLVDAMVGRVAALKPQSAFFERHGSAGIAVLEEVLAAVRAATGSTQVILDAKRGDIGSTMAGYADAYLREGSPLACDALTVSPYLGVGSLAPAFEAAVASGRGLFVLALTSNPEGAEVQHARGSSHESVAGAVTRAVTALNDVELGDGLGLGSIGLVVGATVATQARALGIDLAAVRGPLLAPGVGAQGAGGAELAAFAGARQAVLAATSRAVLAAGPSVDALRAAAATASAEAVAALR